MLRKFYILLIATLLIGMIPTTAQAYTFDPNDIIDDSVFNNFNSMSSGQIDGFLNGFASSCISPASGFDARVPSGYTPSGGFTYGGFGSAGQVITAASQAYSINPQVLISTLEKEQSLITGRNNFAGYCNNGDEHKYAAAVGYGCPDSGTTHSYTGVSLYRRNGVEHTNTGTTCVNTASKAGFSQQVIRAAWLLKFGQQRSRGNINWAVVKGGWDNSDDPQSCYGGPTMQGTFAVCPSSAATLHDGFYTIDSTSVHMDSGATAALYWYTPHFHGNQVFYSLFTQWFGSTKSVPMPGCEEATNTTRTCVWYLTGPNGQPYYTSSINDRQWLVNNEDFNYQTVAFFGNVIPLAGNVPVYRLVKPDGASFITASKAEYDALVAGGFMGLGVDFYADPGESNSGYPVYRLYSSATQSHLWAANIQDRNILINKGYTYEGIAFTSISPVRQEVVPPAGQELVYRFRDMPGGDHFWTRDVYERDQMIRSGYHYEGVAIRAKQTWSTSAVYRLYSPELHNHLYTTDAWEYNVLASKGWSGEGVAFFANPSAGTPVFRLYSPSSHEHFYTSDAWEKSVLVSKGIFKDEGVAWFQP
jgi:hypothetical protein